MAYSAPAPDDALGARLHRTTDPGFGKIGHGAFLESETCISHTSPSVFENPELRGEAGSESSLPSLLDSIFFDTLEGL